MALSPWRLLNTGYADGCWNMALDEAMLLLCSQDKSPPTLRLYAWSQPCLSIGYFQSVEKDIDLGHCQKLGITLVRRPTGGRAVLHEEELAYSVITSENDPIIEGGIQKTYRKISLAIALGLRSLGVEVEAKGPRRGAVGKTAACFDSTSAYELTVAGRKLVGSAQVRRDGALLQHGSILLGRDGSKLSTLLRGTNASFAKRFEERTLSLREVLGRPLSLEEATEGIKRGFQDAWGSIFKEGVVLPEEMALAQRLMEEKYDSQAWNLRR
ncbi:MAG: lipoate--protein ligase family protein [Chloroflexi bacterium]|nr:lipoate--protein ligase family protein [Chloroflexota bacterium]